MRNIDQAKSYFSDAGAVLEEAKQALAHDNLNLAIRRSQETVELAIKGILIFRGIDTPPSRDLSGILLSIDPNRLSMAKKDLIHIAKINHALAQESKTAYYGLQRDEQKEKLFSAERAAQAVEESQEVLNLVIKASLR
ncbi:MAG TPA: HEPN domain-containing protein [bacterium (Candidatus Stahlbacteria)]|nr:HEPN domain-containing protein [Candidatus Stahlbacteria bacterium]